MDKVNKTKNVYGFLWKRNKKILPIDKWHFNNMQEVINEPIVRGSRGIDVGSGCGYDTYIMAKNNPFVKIVSIDISDGVYITKELTSRLNNTWIMKCSVLDMPIKDNIFDFAYSFGVLHHIIDIEKAFLELVRIIKRNAPLFLYLYEDHSENIIKYIAVRIITQLRKITVKLHPRILYGLSYLVSPFIFIIFSFPSKILIRFKATQYFASKIPFNFGKSFFSLGGSLYDRFSAPIENRFDRQEVYDMLSKFGFCNINITRLKDSAGWVAWGYKNNA